MYKFNLPTNMQFLLLIVANSINNCWKNECYLYTTHNSYENNFDSKLFYNSILFSYLFIAIIMKFYFELYISNKSNKTIYINNEMYSVILLKK